MLKMSLGKGPWKMLVVPDPLSMLTNCTVQSYFTLRGQVCSSIPCLT